MALQHMQTTDATTHSTNDPATHVGDHLCVDGLQRVGVWIVDCGHADTGSEAGGQRVAAHSGGGRHRCHNLKNNRSEKGGGGTVTTQALTKPSHVNAPHLNSLYMDELKVVVVVPPMCEQLLQERHQLSRVVLVRPGKNIGAAVQ